MKHRIAEARRRYIAEVVARSMPPEFRIKRRTAIGWRDCRGLLTLYRCVRRRRIFQRGRRIGRRSHSQAAGFWKTIALQRAMTLGNQTPGNAADACASGLRGSEPVHVQTPLVLSRLARRL